MRDELGDYLDAFAEKPRGVALGGRNLVRRQLGDIPLPGGGELPPPSTTPTSGTSPTRFVRPSTPITLPGEPAWYDWSHQTLAWAGPKILQFAVMIGEVRRETDRLQATYQARLRGATFDPKLGEYTTFRMPGPCPVLGGLDYVYPDIFGGCQIQLKRLSDFPPPRYTPVATVLAWGELVRWNIALLAAATNIRPMFLFPQTTPRSNTDAATDYRTASTRTMRTCTGDCARPEGWVDGAPYNLFTKVTAPGADARTGERFVGPQEWLDYVTSDRAGIPSTVPVVTETSIDALGRVVPLNMSRADFLAAYDPFVGGPSTYPSLTDASDVAGAHNPGDLVRYLADEERDTRGNYGSGQYTRALKAAFPIAWSKVQSYYTFRFPGTTGAAPIVAPFRWIEGLAAQAGIYSRLSLATVIKESFGFYAFNHLVFYRASAGLSPEQLAAQQHGAQVMALTTNEVTGSIIAISTTVITAINPIAGAIYAALVAIGSALLDALLLSNLSVDSVRPLFVRLPSRACVPPTNEQMTAELARRAGSEACPPGQERVGTACVPVCPPGQRRDARGACAAPPAECPTGQIRNSAGVCVTPPTACPSGQERIGGVCVPACPAGQIRDATGACFVPPCPEGQERKASGECAPKATGGGAGVVVGIGAALLALRLLFR